MLNDYLIQKLPSKYMVGLYFVLFFPLKGKKNCGRSQEQIILLFWKLPNRDSGLGALNSISFSEKAGSLLLYNNKSPHYSDVG